MSELYLYHATDRKNLESILKNGLLINPPDRNFDNMYVEDQLFLAFSCDAALEYLQELDNPPKDIIYLKIKLDSLHSSCISYDWNNRCEYYKDINSIAYEADIPGNCISTCSPSSEPSQDIWDFKRTDLFDIVMDTFDYEVETNLEHEDDDY